MRKPFEIRVPSETADLHKTLLNATDTRDCGNGCDILGYDTEEDARNALRDAKLAAAVPSECYPVRGFSVKPYP